MSERHKTGRHRPSVVLLVDNKRRDLMVATLIALHLEQQGLQCHLEPLEAYRGVLAAHHPSLILFNHLTAPHLVDYSQRLARLGVLTAVLPNEGILYDPHVLAFNAGKYHNGAHIDLFFCWNQTHKDALQKAGFDQTQIEVVGVPRFDFYFPPWSEVFQPARPASSPRPRILFCTNFVFAKFKDVARETTENILGQWAMIPHYRDYWKLVEVNCAARRRMFGFLNALVGAARYHVVLRPHPAEPLTLYQQWHEQLPPAQQALVTLDRESNITELILACDLEISCETCTTALESWIARRPTIELLLEKHPVFYHANLAAMTAACEQPADLVTLVEKQLVTPTPGSWAEARREHLRAWCHAPAGNSSLQIAQAMAGRLDKAAKPDWTQLRWPDYRRALKLSLLRTLGQAYHYDPLLGLKRLLFKRRFAIKSQTYHKSILPKDVRAARLKLAAGISRRP
jgi:surface carbohydrate biosynthesis protein